MKWDWLTARRCCFCIPIRFGVLFIAYIKLVFSAIMVFLYSLAVNKVIQLELIYQGVAIRLPAELCVFIYCIECMFAAFLIYGARKKLLGLVSAYYYFSISTLFTTTVIQIAQIARYNFWNDFKLDIFCSTLECIQLYLTLLVRSLVKKLEVDGPHVNENQLHQSTNGQAKVEPNGVSNPSTVPVEA